MSKSYLENFDLGDLDDLGSTGIKGNPNDYVPPITDHPSHSPVFGFDYLALDASGFCFNNPQIPAQDFISLFLKLKQLSSISFGDLSNAVDASINRFHEVNPEKLRPHKLEEHFRRLSGRTISMPTLYQFGLYTDSEAQKAPRVVGFIGKWGIFYLIWMDFNHAIYPKKN